MFLRFVSTALGNHMIAPLPVKLRFSDMVMSLIDLATVYIWYLGMQGIGNIVTCKLFHSM